MFEHEKCMFTSSVAECANHDRNTLTLNMIDFTWDIIKRKFIYSKKLFPNSRGERSYWLFRGHMTSNNKNCFPTEVSEQATLQNLWRQRVTLRCCPWMMTDEGHFSKSTSCYKTLNDWFFGKPVNFVSLLPEQNQLFPSGTAFSE